MNNAKIKKYKVSDAFLKFSHFLFRSYIDYQVLVYADVWSEHPIKKFRIL